MSKPYQGLSALLGTAEVAAAPALFRSGLAAGAEVLTLGGALPVEYLEPGDRIVTREGTRVLRAVIAGPAPTLICIPAATLDAESPQADLLVTLDAPILVRDWRAMALAGKPRDWIAARRLVDGEFIRCVPGAGRQVYQLDFDAPVTIYVSGAEITVAPALVGA